MTGGSPDERFMARAIEIARARLGRTAPNPAVGCVLVRDGATIGEGATGDGGRPHAEEIALKAAGAAARGATAYICLEPCSTRSSGSSGRWRSPSSSRSTTAAHARPTCSG